MTPATTRNRKLSAATGLGLFVLVVLSVTSLVTGPDVAIGQEGAKLEGEASVFPGMVDVPAGKFEMGVDEDWFKDTFMKNRRAIPPVLKGAQKQVWWALFLLETPEHRVSTDAYAIDRYEVTNAQYLRFLKDACQVSVFTDLKKSSIELVAAEIYGMNTTDWQIQSLYWLNHESLQRIADKVLKANEGKVKVAIDRFNADLPPRAHMKKFEELPEVNRVKAWVGFDLPEGTALRGYSRTVPKHWKKAEPVKSADPNQDQMSNAVRYVSGRDAEAYAAWAGKHIPTEAEWEKAARGPKNFIYPWGDTFDAEAQRHFLIWNGAPSWKGAPGRDRPAIVTACPEGQSGYGCFNMLGNVMEWTSSIPERYPRSDAKWHSFGGRDLRVCRGGAYGGGLAYGPKEISFRATARILDGPGGAVDVANRYQAVGFRCAKYPTPARDVLAHGLAQARADGFLDKSFVLDVSNGFGAERPSYAASDEKSGMVFVTGESMIVGVVPFERLDASSPKNVVKASEDAPVYLAWLQWHPSIKVAVLKKVEAEAGDEAEKPPAEGEEKPEDAGADENGDEEEGNGTDAEPAPAPVAPTEKEALILGRKQGFLIGLDSGRLALFALTFGGPEFYGYISAAADAPEPIRKLKEKDFTRTARVEGNVVTFDIPILTRSKGSRDVFAVSFKLRVEGAARDGWLATEK